MLRALLPLLLIGCAARRGGDAVGKVDFAYEGGPAWWKRPFLIDWPNRRALRNAMSHPQPRPNSFVVPGLVEPAWLDRERLDSDAWRLEVFYANQGFFDARFLGWELIRESRPGRRLQRIRVVGHVDEGEPSRLREDIAITGLERLTRPVRGRLLRVVTLRKGDVFKLDEYEATVEALRTTLLDRSYAHAKVAGRVVAHPDERAVDITIDVVTGPACRFGPVTVEGLEKVPAEAVADLLEVREGEPFSATALAETRAKLYALHVFGVVDVVPDLSDPTSPIVPVRVQVRESKFRELRAGPVLELEPGKAALMAQASYRDENVGGRLWRMEQEARAGVGVLVDDVWALPTITGADIKPVVDVKGSVELPRLFDERFSLLNQGRVEVGLEPAYTYFSSEFVPTLVYTGFEDLRLSVGYRIRYLDYSDFEDLSVIEDSPLRLDLTDPYLLSMLEQRMVYDGRNDPVETTRGWYASLALAEAGVFDEGNFSFFRAMGEVRAYRGIVKIGNWDPDVVFAGRLGGGIILPYGEPGGAEPSTPYAERLYLGGSNTVRGWAMNRLGPIVRAAELQFGRQKGDPDETTYPAGGELQLFGNFEVRKGGLPFGLTAVGFVDAGRVWATPDEFEPAGIQWSVGGGLRYGTPVGPIRVDVGYRLGDLPDPTREEPRVTLHLSLSEAF